MSAERVEVCQFIRLEHAASFEADGWDVAPCGGHHFVNHGALLAVAPAPTDPAALVREMVGDLGRRLAAVDRDLTLRSHHIMDLIEARTPGLDAPSIAEIQEAVAAHFGLRVLDMKSKRRARAVARPRQVAMWLCKRLTVHSLPTIGAHFGNRDHTTVMHAVRKIDDLRTVDADLAASLETLRQCLTREGR